ncbi:enoyl-CoA hydratase/isomerase family protein [Actinocrispum wychmicini]|uniref:Enoyl-CoA hydratase/2-(1,2-epoxy-1,2-dihydrophenyl)acetyl-CoA isomerase n=1 Tax=Actinocrispum wychmicini TaxID=1213861 RepID=A0A4R2IT11_9PSEU|nr:enoyl-CoA hydratase-related protein [Actinocrispum wychmicini]TCO47369.1 enoyl-CoA hydratase/2-(1,2-epoxy-1,2-dihydrophenyl)acetyl-CoA isomerase [Actinocrispum wychmicini]
MTDLKVTREGTTTLITFDRPEVLNAFRDNTFTELHAALDEAGDDPAVRVVVLTGAGRAFSAGVDLAETRAQLRDATEETTLARLTAFQDVTRRLVAYPKTVISAVNGIAVGVGAELAIASDLRIAGASAEFAFMEVRRGLYPTNGVLFFLPRLVGHGRAMDLLLSGDRLPAADALTAGLVSRVLPDDDLIDGVLAVAETIGSAAPVPVGLIKRDLGRTWNLDLEGVLDLEVHGSMACMRSHDLAEGLDAFAEKRAPDFQ